MTSVKVIRKQSLYTRRSFCYSSYIKKRKYVRKKVTNTTAMAEATKQNDIIINMKLNIKRIALLNSTDCCSHTLVGLKMFSHDYRMQSLENMFVYMFTHVMRTLVQHIYTHMFSLQSFV